MDSVANIGFDHRFCIQSVEATQDYNSQFWNRLQNEWKKISDDEDTAHPWLSDLTEFYDPYKVQYSYLGLVIFECTLRTLHCRSTPSRRTTQ